MNADRVFRLFASCIPVKGARRSTVCDLQRGGYHLIPNGLYEILTAHRDSTLAQVRAAYGNRHDATIDQYYRFLEERELGFWCDDPGEFPDLDLEWDRSEPVTNAIVDVDAGSDHDFASIVGQLDDLGCRALQLRVFCEVTPGRLDAILGALAGSRLRSLELMLRHAAWMTDAALGALAASHRRVTSLFVHSAPAPRTLATPSGLEAHFRTERVDSHTHCGQVHPAYFTVNIATFTEAQRFNTCLNRKISVDARGDIRNCPSLPASYGNVRDTSLHAALAREGFRDLWEINKDQVETCRECEFRYVCIDCRAFVRAPGDRYSRPSKCTYDPSTARWGSPAPEHSHA
jgi:SPASM domain peptide maturase of grasp-with-spasm system